MADERKTYIVAGVMVLIVIFLMVLDRLIF